MKKTAPALFLLVLAPLVGEFLLGNLPLNQSTSAVALPPLILLYGGGAVLIREIARRTHRGWPTIMLLALAYGVIEEGLVTQSLFNPNYLDLHNHDYGSLPALGMGAAWTLFVLTIHSVWSILIPIALTEAIFSARASQPWLRTRGVIGFGVLYVLGVALFGLATYASEEFFASSKQLMGAGAAIVVLIVLAFSVRRGPRREFTSRRSWSPLMLGITTFVGGSLFFLLYQLGATERLYPATLEIVVSVLVMILVFSIIIRNSHKHGWSSQHRFALVVGAVLTYCWAGFLVQMGQYGFHAVSTAIQIGLVVGAVILLATGARHVHLAKRSQSAEAADLVQA